MRRRVISASMPSRLALKPALPVATVFSMMAMDSILSVSAGSTRNVIHAAGLEFRHCEERSDEAIHSFFPWRDGLLRFARNDGWCVIGRSMPDPKNLPRFRRACDLAPGVARASGDAFDQLPVRGHLGAVAEIEGVLEPGAEMAAQISAALVQRPDFGAADRGDLPMRFGQFQLQENRQQF